MYFEQKKQSKVLDHSELIYNCLLFYRSWDFAYLSYRGKHTVLRTDSILGKAEIPYHLRWIPCRSVNGFHARQSRDSIPPLADSIQSFGLIWYGLPVGTGEIPFHLRWIPYRSANGFHARQSRDSMPPLADSIQSFGLIWYGLPVGDDVLDVPRSFCCCKSEFTTEGRKAVGTGVLDGPRSITLETATDKKRKLSRSPSVFCYAKSTSLPEGGKGIGTSRTPVSDGQSRTPVPTGYDNADGEESLT